MVFMTNANETTETEKMMGALKRAGWYRAHGIMVSRGHVPETSEDVPPATSVAKCTCCTFTGRFVDKDGEGDSWDVKGKIATKICPAAWLEKYFPPTSVFPENRGAWGLGR